jgi:hypothetical protein
MMSAAAGLVTVPARRPGISESGPGARARRKRRGSDSEAASAVTPHLLPQRIQRQKQKKNYCVVGNSGRGGGAEKGKVGLGAPRRNGGTKYELRFSDQVAAYRRQWCESINGPILLYGAPILFRQGSGRAAFCSVSRTIRLPPVSLLPSGAARHGPCILPVQLLRVHSLVFVCAASISKSAR